MELFNQLPLQLSIQASQFNFSQGLIGKNDCSLFTLAGKISSDVPISNQVQFSVPLGSQELEVQLQMILFFSPHSLPAEVVRESRSGAKGSEMMEPDGRKWARNIGWSIIIREQQMRKQFKERGLSPQVGLQESLYRSPQKMGRYLSPVQLPPDSNFCSSSPHLYLSQKSTLSHAPRPPHYVSPKLYNSKSCSALPNQLKTTANTSFATHQPHPFQLNLAKLPPQPALPKMDRNLMEWSTHRKFSARDGVGQKDSRLAKSRVWGRDKQKQGESKSVNILNVDFIPKIDLSYVTSSSSSAARSPPKSINDYATSHHSSNKPPKIEPPLPNKLLVPLNTRTKTHSLQKSDHADKKHSKVPAFIKTKHCLPDLTVKKSVSQNQLSYKQQAAQDNQEENRDGFEIHINIKPAVKQRTIQDFKLVRLLGSGSFGDAHIAIDRKIGFVCIVKILPKDRIAEYQSQNSLLREIKIQSYLDHKHLTNLYGCFSDEQNVYMVMELLPSGNLKEKVKNRALSEKTVANYIYQICNGISFMHSNNIIHRDLKPQNIFTSENYVKLGDFGCAVYCQDRRRSFVGSPCYLSPEQLRQEQYDEKIDIWEIGTIMYELLFKVCPFEQDILEIAQGQRSPTVLSTLYFPHQYTVSEQAKDFMTRALDKNPQTRMSIQEALSHSFFQHSLQDSEMKCIH